MKKSLTGLLRESPFLVVAVGLIIVESIGIYLFRLPFPKSLCLVIVGLISLDIGIRISRFIRFFIEHRKVEFDKVAGGGLIILLSLMPVCFLNLAIIIGYLKRFGYLYR